MIYLLIGGAPQAKDKKILEIKERTLATKESHHFDYEILSAHKLDSETLKKSLIALPALASKRLVVVRDGHRLSDHNKEILNDIILQKLNHLVLILDSNEWDDKNAFVKSLKGRVQYVSFGVTQSLNVFDMTRAIEMNKKTEALKILDELLGQGQHPLQIIGGLVWFWGKNKNRVSKNGFEDGLLAIQEADLNIKRSRLKPEQALEMLVVKLCLQGEA